MSTAIAPEMLVILEKEFEKYPTLATLITSRNFTTGALLTPEGMQLAVNATSNDDIAYAEAFSLFDTLSMLDIFYNPVNSPSSPAGPAPGYGFADRFILEVVKNRSGSSERFAIDKVANDRYSPNDPNQLLAIINSNPTLKAMLILCCLKNLFYK